MPEVYALLESIATTALTPKPRKLLDQLRNTLRAKHYSYRTEQAYVY
jgi:hypothetical protein